MEGNKFQNALMIFIALISTVAIIFVYYNMSKEKEDILENEVNDNPPSDLENDISEEVKNYDFSKLFQEAVDLYTIFTTYNYDMELDTSKCVEGEYKQEFCLVKDSRFSDYNELKQQLINVFGAKVADTLLAVEVNYEPYGWNYLYKEVDGKTYRLTDIRLETWNGANYSAVSNDIEPIIINNSLVLLKDKMSAQCMQSGDDPCTIEKDVYYVVEKDSNDNWIFNGFEIPMEHIHGNYLSSSVKFGEISLPN